jgi:predicted DCC family thiol-disulfide oxidoreductase YuxK
MSRHLVFYDGKCGLCDHAVQFILKFDRNAIFDFSPLQGKTADQLLQGISREDSLVLIENYKTLERKMFFFGKAAFRILWLLGGIWCLIGWINFLPSFLYDWAYRIVAKNRHRIFSNESCILPTPSQKSRFLP